MPPEILLLGERHSQDVECLALCSTRDHRLVPVVHLTVQPPGIGRLRRRSGKAEADVISLLRDKRTELTGIVVQMVRQLAQRRANMTHLDATMQLFDTDLRPGDVHPRQERPRSIWFGRDERQRALIQKTILGSLNRAKQTIERAGFEVHVAARLLSGETEGEVRAGFARLFAGLGIGLDAAGKPPGGAEPPALRFLLRARGRGLQPGVAGPLA